MFRRETLRIARKKHRCCMCRICIDKGTPYMDVCGAENSEFYHYKLCERCDYVLDKFAIICDDELLPDITEAIIRVYKLECENENCVGGALTIELEQNRNIINLYCRKCGSKRSINISLKGLKKFELIEKLKN